VKSALTPNAPPSTLGALKRRNDIRLTEIVEKEMRACSWLQTPPFVHGNSGVDEHGDAWGDEDPGYSGETTNSLFLKFN
jgi:hypothetical protein